MATLFYDILLAISLVLMAFILLCMSITNQLDNEDMEGVVY